MLYIKEKSLSDKTVSIVSYSFVILTCILILYPFIYIIANSLSSITSVMRNEVFFFPKGFTIQAYEAVFKYGRLWLGFGNSFFYTFSGAAFSMVLTILAAYPLAKKRWKMRRMLNFYVTFPLWFSVGLIPIFLLYRGMGLYDSRLAVILFNSIGPLYVIILRTGFEGIPDSIEESAKIDGANDVLILYKIILPLVKPTLATIALYYALQRWNSFTWELAILKDLDKLPVQLLLQRLVIASQVTPEIGESLTTTSSTIPMTIKYAVIIVTALPMIILYPFVQKFFVKGMLLGGVKG